MFIGFKGETVDKSAAVDEFSQRFFGFMQLERFENYEPHSWAVEKKPPKRGDELVGRPASVDFCGRKSVLAENGEYRVIFPLKCNSWQCVKCRKRLSAKWLKKIRPGPVERFITLTVDVKRFESVGEAVKKLYSAYKLLVQAIRRKYKKFEYFSVIEFTKQGWPHIHILQRGTYIPHKWLSLQWDKLGMGFIVLPKKVRGRAKEYLVKYMTKEAECFAHHLRKIRYSKNFFFVADSLKKWLEGFSFSISMFSAETEICHPPGGWELLGREGDIGIFRFVGWVRRC